MNLQGMLRPKAGTEAFPHLLPMILKAMAVALLGCGPFALPAAQQSPYDNRETQRTDRVFRQLLQELADFSPDPCDVRPDANSGSNSADVEYRLLGQAADRVVEGLNAAHGPEPPPERAKDALKSLEKASAEINANWPNDNRFHFEIVDLAPALAVKLTIRTSERYFVFGIPEKSFGNGNQLWQEVGSEDESLAHDSARSWLQLFALHRGPSGNARFLAKVEYTGCAGSLGVTYDAREWNPKGSGTLERIVSQEGAFGLNDDVPGFAQIGKLQVEGPLITLPYCWFSVIDTWDNPSLCAVDTYDASSDKIRFSSRVYNRPDLVPVAKALEYAKRRDYPAVLGYCASGRVAHDLVHDVSPHIFAADLRVTRLGKAKEQVELIDDASYRFQVKRRAGRWVVVAFSTR